MWSAGASNSGEENINLYGTPLEEDGGYNLFRVGKGVNTKPENEDGEELKTYVIKRECLVPSEGRKPAHPDLNVPADSNSLSNSERYDDTHYFGKKPPIAIVSNIENIDSDDKHLMGPTNKSNKLYMMDDLNKRKDINDTLDTTPDKSDTYFLKTMNDKNNDFSSCLSATANKQVLVKPGCNKSNPYFQWRVRYDDTLNNQSVSNANVQLQTMKKYDDGINYCLHQHYDTMGKSQYELKPCSTTNNTWKYRTLISDKLPQKHN